MLMLVHADLCSELLICEEEEGFYKFLPANSADRLCQSWQSCSNHHKIWTAYYVQLESEV